jgi:hypothetical protein
MEWIRANPKSTEVRIDPGDVAIWLAEAGNDEQAEFLRVFATRIKRACEEEVAEKKRTGRGLAMGMDSQLCFLGESVDRDTVEILRKIVEFSDLYEIDRRTGETND